jgi:hypothetical protein
MVIFCYQSKVGDEWPSKSNVGLSRSQEPFNHLQCPRFHSKCLVVKWGYKWINPTYPIYNWGYNPLSKWDEPPSGILSKPSNYLRAALWLLSKPIPHECGKKVSLWRWIHDPQHSADKVIGDVGAWVLMSAEGGLDEDLMGSRTCF